jgi:CotH kinase protein
MKTLSIFHFLFLAAATAASGQAVEPFTLIKPTHPNPTNTVSFSLHESRLTQLHDSRSEKLSFNVPVTVVNGDSIKTEHIHIRGTSSSQLRRKSLNIKLHKKAVFYEQNDTFSLKKFYAVSMNMDKNYIRNKISYKVLGFMNITIPSSSYANLLINNKSEGLYMIFDPPEEFAIKERNATVVIRRLHNETMDDMAYDGIASKDAAEFRKKFQSIYKEIIHKHKGEELYQKLGEVLDLNGYFTWLAYNHLFQNGDYSDELYLMWNKSSKRFEIIPWDFDDLLHAQPHEGFEKRNAILHDKLIFSSEDALDVKIANDDFLYRKYLQAYKQFLEKLAPSVLNGILNSVYQDVYPYYLQSDIVAQAQYDQGGATDMTKLEEDIQKIAQFINSKVAIHQGKIERLLKGMEGTR